MRLNVPKPYLPFADGEFSDAEREVRVLLGAAGGDGTRSAPDVHPAVRVPGATSGARGAVSADADLVAGAPVPQHDVREHRSRCAARRASRAASSTPTTPSRAASSSGMRVVVHNDRGAFTAVARVDDSRPRRRGVGAVDLVGASSPPDGAERERRRRRSSRPTWGTARCSTTTWWK